MAPNPYIINSYHQAEKEGRYLDAANLRLYELNSSGVVANNGHAYWSHKLLQQAHQAGQLNSIGTFLGAGPNPFDGRPKNSSPAGAFQQYRNVNGVLYLGDKPYLG